MQYSYTPVYIDGLGWFMVFNATFNNISVILWWSPNKTQPLTDDELDKLYTTGQMGMHNPDALRMLWFQNTVHFGMRTIYLIVFIFLLKYISYINDGGPKLK
jgi:hypothetical protein